MPSIRQSREHALSLSVGGVVLSLRSSQRQLLERARQRYDGFLSPSRAGFPVQVFREAHERAPAGAGPPVFFLERAALALNAKGATFYGVENEFVLDSLIRVLLTKFLLPCPGFLLHAATVVHRGEGHVFMGRSGAGKSTVASLSPAGSALTDEISLLRREGGQWRAYGTPFWGEFRADGQNRSVPLAAVHSLVQAAQNRRESLPGNAPLASLLANTLFFLPGRAGREALLGILTEFVREVPVYRLEFRKDPTFWEVAA